jgi:hypothetical protein
VLWAATGSQLGGCSKLWAAIQERTVTLVNNQVEISAIEKENTASKWEVDCVNTSKSAGAESVCSE